MLSDSENLYIKGINRVQDFIEENLSEPLNITELAKIASFSEFHFQRIYSLFTGESLYSFIKRLRLEKAAFLLTSNRNLSVSHIALDVGFANQASFAKAFKQKFGMSGRTYRNEHPSVNKMKDTFGSIENENNYMEPLSVKIKDEEKLNLIYMRYTGPYKGNSDLFSTLFNKLFSWAKERRLIDKESRWFVIYHDKGFETEEEKLRLSLCLSISGNVALSEGVGLMELQPGKYAVGEFWVDSSEYSKAWYYMFAKWLPHSGYVIDESHALEHYPPVEVNDENKRLVEIYIPIRKA